MAGILSYISGKGLHRLRQLCLMYDLHRSSSSCCFPNLPHLGFHRAVNDPAGLIDIRDAAKLFHVHILDILRSYISVRDRIAVQTSRFTPSL